MLPLPIFAAVSVIMLLAVVDRKLEHSMQPQHESDLMAARELAQIDVGTDTSGDPITATTVHSSNSTSGHYSKGTTKHSSKGTTKHSSNSTSGVYEAAHTAVAVHLTKITGKGRPVGAGKTTHKVPELGVSVMRWTFDWAATAQHGGRCKCDPVAWGEYPTEEECKHAFADTQFESCVYEDQGIHHTDCKFAVSTDPSLVNSQCVSLCEMLADTNGETQLEAFNANCSLEKYQVTSRGEVILASPYCFTNNVYGHSDLSISSDGMHAHTDTSREYRIAVDAQIGIKTASMCQQQCQLNHSCVSWIWRAIPDSSEQLSNSNGDKFVHKNSTTGTNRSGYTTGTNRSGYRLRQLRRMSSVPSMDAVAESPTHACLLKTQTMIDEAQSAVLPVGQLVIGVYPPADAPLWRVCDIPRKWEEIYKTHRAALPDDTCECGCVWESYKHVSGPKLCSKDRATSSVFASSGTGTGTDSADGSAELGTTVQ